MYGQPVKKKNKANTIMVIIIIVLFLIIGYRFGSYYFYSHDSNATVVDSVVFDEETTEVEIHSLVFKVPKNLIVENHIDYFTVQHPDKQFAARVMIEYYKFDEVYNNYTHLKPNKLASYNGPASQQKYGDKEYVVAPYASRLSKVLSGFTKGNDEKMIVIILINKKNTYDYKMMEKFAEIINSVTEYKKK